MIVLLQVQRRMTFTEKNGKKTNMTHTNVNQINDSNMQLVQVLMESSVHAFVQNHIWSIWWSCLQTVLLYIAEMESIWCPLMYTMTASWSVLTHSFVHANKNKCKKKNQQEHLHPQSAELSGVINKWTCAPLTYCHPDRLPWSCTCPSDIWEAKKLTTALQGFYPQRFHVTLCYNQHKG